MHWTEQRMQIHECTFVSCWRSVCTEKNLDLNVKHVKARTEKEKKAVTNMRDFVVEGNEKRRD